MRILAVGDITSPAGVKHLCEKLWQIREEKSIDFCVVNGENASFITGISRDAAEELLRSGADVITGGNHTMQNFSSHALLDERAEIIRPINYGSSAPGNGYTIINTPTARVLVINVMGNVHIDPILDSPYRYIDEVLARTAGKYDVSILDIHAEATGEKLAIAFSYDGKINVMFGTHTHVPTADGRILPQGSGYISDLGMCGESGGILGMDPSSVLHKLRAKMPGKFKPADGAPVADAVIFTLEDNSGKTKEIERITF